MRRAAAASGFLLLIGFSAEALGYLARPLNTYLAIVFLALFLGLSVSGRELKDFRTKWPGWLLAAVALVGVFCWTGWIRVLFVSLLAGGLRWARRDEKSATDLGIFQITAFVYGLFLWFWRETATGWYALEGLTDGLTWAAGRLGVNPNLGPTAAAIPVTVLLLIFGVVSLGKLGTVTYFPLAPLVVHSRHATNRSHRHPGSPSPHHPARQ
jgi:hypothetical protein